jgi:hypothetical protein
VIGGVSYRQYAFRQTAREAYEYLKLKTLKHRTILIEEHKPAIIKMVKQWSDELWLEVDRLRCDERIMVFFYEHEQLYWTIYK